MSTGSMLKDSSTWWGLQKEAMNHTFPHLLDDIAFIPSISKMARRILPRLLFTVHLGNRVNLNFEYVYTAIF